MHCVCFGMYINNLTYLDWRQVRSVVICTLTTEYRKNRERTPPVVRASGVGSARSVLEVNGNNAL